MSDCNCHCNCHFADENLKLRQSGGPQCHQWDGFHYPTQQFSSSLQMLSSWSTEWKASKRLHGNPFLAPAVASFEYTELQQEHSKVAVDPALSHILLICCRRWMAAIEWSHCIAAGSEEWAGGSFWKEGYFGEQSEYSFASHTFALGPAGAVLHCGAHFFSC